MAGISKAYTLPFDYVLFDMSYANVIMYSAVLPSYDPKKKDKKSGEPQKVIKADDPGNRDKVREFFETCD